MDVFECVSTLSSVRGFLSKDIPDETVRSILEAGRLAPSAHNDQPWQFIAIRDKGILSEMESYCISGRFISKASFAVVVITDPSSKWHEIDSTRAVQNMALTAWGFGIGTCWIGALDKEGIMNLLGIPDGYNVLTVLPFGYVNQDSYRGPKYRKSPSQVFHLDRYGEKFV